VPEQNLGPARAKLDRKIISEPSVRFHTLFEPSPIMPTRALARVKIRSVTSVTASPVPFKSLYGHTTHLHLLKHLMTLVTVVTVVIAL
jgi:hypothetical protein